MNAADTSLAALADRYGDELLPVLAARTGAPMPTEQVRRSALAAMTTAAQILEVIAVELPALIHDAGS